MGSGIYVAASGAVAQSRALDVTANNVANASTPGFRAERLAFGEALGRAAARDTAFTEVGSAAPDLSPGVMRQTGNPLDLALAGDGYFVIDTPRGARYTRAGDFRLDQNGVVTTSGGLPVRARGGGTITVPPGAASIAVAADGSISADGEVVGTLEIARLVPGAMTQEGAGLLAAAGAAPAAGPLPDVVAGAVEGSNFNVVRGVVDLVRVSRTYEALHRVIEGFRAIDERTARSLKGGG
jgi:flagellar basal-body rod protein FlgF